MKVSGFTFIRNAVKNDYPIIEAITSILPLCDEFIVAHGDSSDDTIELIKRINSDKIRIVQTVWNPEMREGGRVFAEETDKAFAAVSSDSDWAFYIQGDECVHEKYHELIRSEMEASLNDHRIEGLLFKYKHFYGSYDYFGDSRKWYRREVRIVRNTKAIHSYRDAQGFRFNGRKLRVKLIDAYIYHYGWVKPPHGLVKKLVNFNLFYDKEAQDRPVPESEDFDYGNAEKLVRFVETHPKVMQPRINAVNWSFSFDPTKIKNTHTFRRRILQKIYELTGIRIGEYRNYRIIKR
jgi:hypothetical protein